MAVKFTNNAKTTLASSLTNVATSASVVDGSVFPTLGAGEYFYCTFDDGSNNEIVKVTARSGNTLTIVRGVDNTSARAFSSGDSAELRATAGLLTDIQENIAAKSANQTVFSTTTASSATDYDIGIDPGVEANASVFLDGVYQHHDTFSFSGSTLTFDTAPVDGTALEVIVDNLVNLQSSNLTVDTFIAADVGGSPQVDFTLSDAPAAETNLIVFVDGVFQANDTYTISSTTLSMTDGVTADRVVTVYVMNPVNIGTPSDGTITSSKLSGDITMPGDLTVTGDVAFDSPTFVVDNANSRVGIGTASPSTLLDIVGDVKMSANLTVDTSTLVVDATNNRVGIGTASPTNALDINGSQVLLANGALKFADAGNAHIGMIKNSGSSGTGQLEFYTGSAPTERMRIESAGTVKISHADTASEGLRVIQTTADRTSGGALGLFYDDQAGTTQPTLKVIQNGTGDILQLFDGASQVVTVKDGGNVGIGTDSPQSLLHLRATAPIISLTDTNSFTDANDRLIFRAGANEGLIQWYDDSSSSTSTIAVFESGGNVGIGKTNPAAKLDVLSGTALIAQFARDGAATYDFTVTDGGDGAAQLYINAQTANTGYNIRPKNASGTNIDALFINPDGNIGLGTNSPSETLELGDGSSTNRIKIDSPTKAHYIGYDGSDDALQIAAQSFLKFQTGGSFGEAMRISSEGNLLINTTSKTSFPTNKGAAAFGIGGEVNLKLSSYGSAHTYQQFILGGSVVGSISSTTSTTSYNQSSDYRLKENVVEMTGALDRVNQLQPKRFNFIADADTIVDGFLAHEVQDIVPQAVTGEKDAVDSEGNPEYQGIDQSKLVPLLTKAIQEQQTQIETLKQEIQELKE